MLCAIKAADVLALMRRMIARHGAPLFISSDNGPKFIAQAIQRCLYECQICTIYIDQGCPWLQREAAPQRAIARITKGYAESFNSRLRAEYLDLELLYNLTETRVVLEDWRKDYNKIRAHRCYGLQTHRNLPIR